MEGYRCIPVYKVGGGSNLQVFLVRGGAVRFWYKAVGAQAIAYAAVKRRNIIAHQFHFAERFPVLVVQV